MNIRRASDRSLLIDCASETARVARTLAGLPGIVNLHPAWESVLVEFDPLRTEAAAFEQALRNRVAGSAQVSEPPGRLVEIPVRYDGCDLDEVARLTGLSPGEVVRRHSAAEYAVRFLGFSPGFPYLTGLPPELAVPRLEAPRKRVPAGSVAIGGAQAGVYPTASPGGWRIVGRTDLQLFDPAADPPALLAMGDRVRFREVRG